MTLNILISRLALALSLLAVQPALAQKSCESDLVERITKCESLLKSADHVIDVQAETIQQLDAQKARIEKELDFALAEAAEDRAWYNNTSIMAPIAFVLGLSLGAYATRGR